MDKQTAVNTLWSTPPRIIFFKISVVVGGILIVKKLFTIGSFISSNRNGDGRTQSRLRIHKKSHWPWNFDRIFQTDYNGRQLRGDLVFVKMVISFGDDVFHAQHSYTTHCIVRIFLYQIVFFSPKIDSVPLIKIKSKKNLVSHNISYITYYDSKYHTIISARHLDT